MAPPTGGRGVILPFNLGGKEMEEFLKAEQRKFGNLQAHIPAAKEFPLLIVNVDLTCASLFLFNELDILVTLTL